MGKWVGFNGFNITMKKWWLDVISGRTMVKNGGFTEKYGDFANLSWLNGYRMGYKGIYKHQYDIWVRLKLVCPPLIDILLIGGVIIGWLSPTKTGDSGLDFLHFASF